MGGGVGEIEGGRGGQYGVLHFVPEDGWGYRFILHEVQNEIGLRWDGGFNCWDLEDPRSALQV